MIMKRKLKRRYNPKDVFYYWMQFIPVVYLQIDPDISGIVLGEWYECE